MEHDTRGGIRMNSRYVSWERLDHFDGVLVRVHTLSEGVRGNFGSISIALTLLWALFRKKRDPLAPFYLLVKLQSHRINMPDMIGVLFDSTVRREVAHIGNVQHRFSGDNGSRSC